MTLRRTLLSLALLTAAHAIHAAEATPEAPKTEILAAAVRERHLVTFVYQGQVRTVEPHACGVVTATGEAVLHGYQIEGGSVSGQLPGWRTFVMAKITDFAVTDKSFAGPRSDYAAGRPHLEPVWAELSAPQP